jgi:hypothetical protein
MPKQNAVGGWDNPNTHPIDTGLKFVPEVYPSKPIELNHQNFEPGKRDGTAQAA